VAASTDQPVYAIAGPTASGKTAIAVRLAKLVNGEVVNFDSVQIYQGISVATAKPTADEMQGIPHHLIDYVDPNIDYTAANWAADAKDVIRAVERRGKTVILAGGTGFYLRSLRNPLFEGPPTDQSLRERLSELQTKKGKHYLYRMLQRIDPAAADKLFPNDGVRVVRALEVFFQTGQRLSDLQPKRAETPEFADRIRLFVLNPPRELLYERINDRARRHFEVGLVEEVKQLLASGVRESGNALGAHGYRRVCELLRGERDLDSAIEKTQQDVRNYAKRQLTWFRKEPDAIWLNGFGESEAVWEELLGHIRGGKFANNATLQL
jgi:tRNA dimethylallyltransferase